MPIPECGCGGKPYFDWWVPLKKGAKEKTFVRCPDCGCFGADADTEEEAIKNWLEFKAI
jgi:hypothetical protein